MRLQWSRCVIAAESSNAGALSACPTAPLQWSRCVIAAESGQSWSQGTLLYWLQWSRCVIAAERRPLTRARITADQRLQWSRCVIAAERHVAANEPGRECPLQWSRCVIAAERHVPGTHEAPEADASMEPLRDRSGEGYLDDATNTLDRALQWSRCVIAAESSRLASATRRGKTSFNGAAA